MNRQRVDHKVLCTFVARSGWTKLRCGVRCSLTQCTMTQSGRVDGYGWTSVFLTRVGFAEALLHCWMAVVTSARMEKNAFLAIRPGQDPIFDNHRRAESSTSNLIFYASAVVAVGAASAPVVRSRVEGFKFLMLFVGASTRLCSELLRFES